MTDECKGRQPPSKTEPTFVYLFKCTSNTGNISYYLSNSITTNSRIGETDELVDAELGMGLNDAYLRAQVTFASLLNNPPGNVSPQPLDLVKVYILRITGPDGKARHIVSKTLTPTLEPNETSHLLLPIAAASFKEAQETVPRSFPHWFR